MDTQLLKAFLAICDSKSFSEAAESLHITQPAVSKRLSALESQLGVSLFDRIGRQVALTESGHKLLPRARHILRELEDTQREISNLSGEISGTLSLATSHHIGLHRLPPILRTYSQQYPNVVLDIAFMDSEKAHQETLHGAIELAIATLAPTADEHLYTQEIWPDPLAVVIAPDHPLSQRNQITLPILSDHPVILPGDNTYTGQIIKALFAKEHLSLNVLMATNYLETIKMLVGIGLGWSVLPKSMLDKQMRAVEVNRVNLQRSLGYLYHRKRTLSNAARAFITLLDKSSS